MTDLSGKVAVVTGAASGIGKAISTSFVKAGATVFISDVNIDGGKKLCSELQKINSDTTFLKTDVSKEEEVKELILAAEKKFGKVGVMVNNAARPIGGYPLTDMSNEDWQAVIASNLSSVFYGCKHSIPIFKKNGGGSIINTSLSSSTHTSSRLGSLRCCTKGGIISMTRQLATEFGPYKY